MYRYLTAICFFFTATSVQAQTAYKKDIGDSILSLKGTATLMPYNRLIQSAGKVINYGNPALENHTLDVCVLPNKKLIAVEDRYGIAIINTATKTLQYRWSLEDNATYKNCMSTYSGIKNFSYNGSTYIVWSVADKGNKAYIIMAEWDGEIIKNVSHISVPTLAPATNSLPNAVIINFESNTPFIYAVLNGNNQLIKVNFLTKQIVWAANTGVAPFGIAIVNNKAYVTNWAGPLVTDKTLEKAGTPWGEAYTNPTTGATKQGSLSIINITYGSFVNELNLGLHPNAIINSTDNRFLYVANGNSDIISVIDVQKEVVVDSINVGLFSKEHEFYGSSPNALLLSADNTKLYVANGLDNAVAVVNLGKTNTINGYIPTEAYPSGLALVDNNLYVTNLEAKGASVLSEAKEFKQPNSKFIAAYSIHKQLASLSIIPIPSTKTLSYYTQQVKAMNFFYRAAVTNLSPRKNVLPVPLPKRIGEPSVFKHVVYIIKENKTYDQVYGDVQQGKGDARLCVFGDSVTPNQHKMVKDFGLFDNYYASGKSSAEGHQWTDAAMVSDYIEKNVRAWFRSYPHRQEDALVYNKSGFIWNNALDHSKKVRVYGEACTTSFNNKMKWLDIYNNYTNGIPMDFKNNTTIARLRPIISPNYPDCDNVIFTDQIRASVFINDIKKYEQQAGDSMPDLMILSLPNDHSAGTSPGFPTPRAMVADNDLALGRIMETLTHSRFWDSTVVFVTEDDSQGGWDHISAYRTTCLVMSAYANTGKTIHTNYNQTSMVRTIEQILGIPPMNIIDATALPMFDCFGKQKSAYQYQTVTNKIALNEMNPSYTSLKGKALYYAKLSANSVFKEIDGGEDEMMNKILWFYAKGNLAYPNPSY